MISRESIFNYRNIENNDVIISLKMVIGHWYYIKTKLNSPQSITYINVCIGKQWKNGGHRTEWKEEKNGWNDSVSRIHQSDDGPTNLTEINGVG
jgi:hypothetical protein